jgi:hypothetical protein
MGETRNAYRILGKQTLERLRKIWKDNIKMCIREISYMIGGTGLMSCPVAGVGISGDERLDYATKDLGN